MTRCVLKLLAILILCTGAARAELRWIVRATGGANAVQNLCRLLGCGFTLGLGDPDSQLFLIGTSGLPPLSALSSLLGLTGIVGVELDLPLRIVPLGGPGSKPLQPPAGLLNRKPVSFFGSTVWEGYANQPAADVIRVRDAQSAFHVQGSGIVAIVDTGIDPNHPVLRSVVVPGYDFTRNQYGFASETADVSQSTVAVVDGGPPVQVNGSTVAVLDQSTVAVVDNPKYAAFGHGTMVAGIVHLVAPEAMIMPLKAFGADGSGYTSDIVRAVYYAAKSNARVINMSFSLSSYSSELKKALDYAVSRQIICVASAGNDGRQAMVYPAGFDNTMGVGSTNLTDMPSTFSNYGDSLVWVAAPGEGIVSAYPLGTYAAGWGTSFSTPFVSGTAALLLDLKPGTDELSASQEVAKAKYVGHGMGNGRLDVFQALDAAKSGH